MESNNGSKPAADRLYTVLDNCHDFMFFWGYDIYVEDGRTWKTPQTSLGKIIGITLDKVLLRINNDVTNWFPLNQSKVHFFIDPMAINGDKEYKRKIKKFIRNRS
jgi:hypothetical protein